ncbi:uncharacterized protein LOC111633998 isoform X1 [Centruroides sculpturatus]|uniref:uncharacterized protein LOC111633998 isoform X1 n=1 Tax=Centruroides sculpturatus TaxID=218467 RepID=UPI000C6E0977|nr:uncharacterized protein LOC111633998 isoform X1 [Centruroides sculpturatus]
MPTHFKWKVNGKKKLHKPTKKAFRQPPWDNSITDLTNYQLTPDEIKRRHVIHKSKNAEIAKLELIEKYHPSLKNTSDSSINNIENEHNSHQVIQDYLSVPFVTIPPVQSTKDSIDNTAINEDCKNRTNYHWINENFENVNVNTSFQAKYFHQELQVDPYDIQELLLNLQRKLNIEDSDKSTETDETETCVSSVTSLFIKTLDKLSQKYVKIQEELKKEKKARHRLQKEVEGLKLIVNEVMQNVTSLHEKVNNSNTVNCSQISFCNQQCQTDLTSDIPTRDDPINANNKISFNNEDKCFTASAMINNNVSELSNMTSVNCNCSSVTQGCVLPHQWTKAIMLKPPIQLDLNTYKS